MKSPVHTVVRTNDEKVVRHFPPADSAGNRGVDEPASSVRTESVHRRGGRCILLVVLLLSALTGFRGEHSAATDAVVSGKGRPPVTARKPPGWTPLFDGRSLKGWKITKFGGEGEVTVKNGRILLGFGSDLTGIHTRRPLPTTNYEVELEAMRVDGSDFFCGFTFPVKKSHCSLILGGWGGGVCGLSCIDKLDASENETTHYRKFKNGRWYKIRLRVTEEKIEVWLDDRQIIDQNIKRRKISVRVEVEPSRPFGFATWQTTGALRNIRLRKLSPLR